MIFHLWRYEWKRLFKHPGLFLFVLIFPIALLSGLGVFMYSLAQEELDTVYVLVLDEDQTFETNALIEQLQKDDTIDGDVQFIKGEESIEYYLKNRESYAAVVEVPEGFTKQLRSGVNESINVYLNQNMPLASSLAYIFFESGQNYITAAQTGVNTVNHFYIQNLEERDERSRWIQQMTLHFTMFALDRNQLLEEKDSTDQGVLSWDTNLYLMIISLLLFLTYILLTIIFNRKDHPIIQERLKLISVTMVNQYMATMLYHTGLLTLYAGGIAWLLQAFIFQSIAFNWMVFVQWLIVALMLSVIYMLSHLLLRQNLFSYIVFIFLSLAYLVISGLVVPPAYLPANISELSVVNNAFVLIWVDQTVPVMPWVTLFGGTLILLTLVFAFRKVGSRP